MPPSLSWLQSLALPDPKERERMRAKRPFCAGPVLTTGWEGLECTVVTDAKMLLLLRWTYSYYPDLPRCDAGSLSNYLSNERLWHRPDGPAIDLRRLKDWCGPYDPPVTCPVCNGEGFVVGDGYDHEKDEDAYNCKRCQGDGGWGGDARKGLLRGVLLDRNRLAHYLAELDGEAGFVPSLNPNDRPGTGPAALVAPEWAVVIMPLNKQLAGDDPAPVFEEGP